MVFKFLLVALLVTSIANAGESHKVAEKIISDVITKSACEGSSLDIVCPRGQHIFVKSIQIVLNSQRCSKKNPIIRCTNQTYAVKSRTFALDCKNKERCIRTVNNELFGRECSGDQRHVIVKYVCSLYKIDENNQIIRPKLGHHEEDDHAGKKPKPHNLDDDSKILLPVVSKGSCENSTISLICPKGRYLFVKSVQVSLNSNRCKLKSAIVRCSKEVYVQKSRIIAARCKNQQNCNVGVNRESFGRECTGDIRYMRISYTCSKYQIDNNNQFIIPKQKEEPKVGSKNDVKENSKPEEAKQLVVERKDVEGCENDLLSIGCEQGKQLAIRRIAVHVNSDKCSHGSLKTFCTNETYALKAVSFAKACKNKDKCDFKIGSEVFGKECDGDVRFVQVGFECRKIESEIIEQKTTRKPRTTTKPVKIISDQITKIACEGSSLDITCPRGQHIFIRAIQVTLNSQKCSKKTPFIRCTNSTYIEKSRLIALGCRNKEQCIRTVNNELFGRECKGDQRHVLVRYVCSLYKIDENNQVIIPRIDNHKESDCDDSHEHHKTTKKRTKRTKKTTKKTTIKQTTARGSTTASPGSNLCELPKDNGSCRGYFPRFFYNSKTQKCEQFIYGGCGGNENRFGTFIECLQKCSRPITTGKSTTRPTTQVITTTTQKTTARVNTTSSPVSNFCELPSDAGSCTGIFPRFFYNSKTQKCEQFIYGGCGGNANRFGTFIECLQKCWKPSTSGESTTRPTTTSERTTERPSTTVRTTERVNTTSSPASNLCELPSDTGLCRGSLPRFYFNSKTQKCEEFIYGGCGGNANRFETILECEQRCWEDHIEDKENPLSPVISVNGCESTQLNLTCPKGRFMFIRLIHVILNSKQCNIVSSKIKCSNDQYQAKSQVIAKNCKNKDNCLIKINDETFGDECKGDMRYMTINYQCSKYQIGENNQIIIPKN